eukprot:759607-Hanusia_phi.AAC.2
MSREHKRSQGRGEEGGARKRERNGGGSSRKMRFPCFSRSHRWLRITKDGRLSHATPQAEKGEGRRAAENVDAKIEEIQVPATPLPLSAPLSLTCIFSSLAFSPSLALSSSLSLSSPCPFPLPPSPSPLTLPSVKVRCCHAAPRSFLRLGGDDERSDLRAAEAHRLPEIQSNNLAPPLARSPPPFLARSLARSLLSIYSLTPSRSSVACRTANQSRFLSPPSLCSSSLFPPSPHLVSGSEFAIARASALESETSRLREQVDVLRSRLSAAEGQCRIISQKQHVSLSSSSSSSSEMSHQSSELAVKEALAIKVSALEERERADEEAGGGSQEGF